MTESDSISILHLVASSHGGGATHVRDLALAMSHGQYPTAVAMPDDKGTVNVADFARHQVEFHLLSGKLGQIRRLAGQVDILHCHGARAAFLGRLATMASGAKRPKIVYTIHGFMIPHYPHPRRFLLTWQERLQASQVDQYIAVSQAEQNSLHQAGLGSRFSFWRAGGGSDDKVVIIWYGIKTDNFEHPTVARETIRAGFGLKPNDIVLGMICRFFWPRDFPTLLKAFSQAVKQEPRLRLLLVGDGPWRPQIETLLKELNLQHNQVIMPGIRKDITNLLHACDVFVLTSGGGDGLPISILEAMAAARPVIATKTDGIPEEVIDGETGLVPPLRDVIALTEAIVQLAQNADLRQAMGLAGQRRVQTFFRLEQMVDKTAAVYRQLLG